MAQTYRGSTHLERLLRESDRLACLVAAAPRAARAGLREGLLAEAAVASLQLDGSPLTSPPDPPDGGGPPGPAVPTGPTERGGPFGPAGPPPRPAPGSGTGGEAGGGTWLDALCVGEGPDERILALEYRGARAALESDDLAPRLLAEPGPALAELHRRLTAGLLSPDRAGVPRRTRQAVHDGSEGRILYFAADPADVPGRLEQLSRWLSSTAPREHGLVASGVAHRELLDLHPFEAASGRLARAAARLLLRTRGLDPDGLVAVEVELARDPLGYYREVAATTRRDDLTVWLERWGEAVAGALRRVARRLDLLDEEVPGRARRFLTDRGDPAFTLADYREQTGLGAPAAREDLTLLLDAGLVERTPGARGLRFRIR